MTEELLNEVQTVYLAVALLPDDQQIDYLERLYSNRPEIRTEVESLLQYKEAGSRLTQEGVSRAAAEVLEDDDSLIGKLVDGKYRVRECIGRGGQADVYLADHVALETPFALKRARPLHGSDPDSRRRFLEEARRAVILRHNNIARVHDVLESDDDMFVVMEHIEGENLRSRLARQGRPFTTAEFLPIAIQCSAAIAAAHEKDIVHLDVKPENIMLTPADQVKICDFGVAHRLSAGSSSATASSAHPWSLAGTPAYMAPEVLLQHPFDKRADLFALGTVFYEMLTGTNPFLADTVMATTARVVSEMPVPGRKVPPKLNRVILRLLAKDPSRRYASADELTETLQLIQTAPTRRFTGVWKAVAMLLICAGIVGIVSRKRSNTAGLTTEDSILIADFANTTPDSVFDDTLKRALAIQLDQSPFLNIVSEPKAREGLQYMGQPAGAAVQPSLARQLCQRVSASALLLPAIAKLGDHYVISIDAENCRTGDTIAREQVEAVGRQEVLKSLGLLAETLRQKLGESLASVQRFDVPIETATTPSLDALKFLSQGQKLRYEGKSAESIPFFKQAIELDADFALAYSRLSAVYNNLGQTASAAEYSAEAYKRRNRASERERFYIDSTYFLTTIGDIDKAGDTYQLWKAAYPADDLPYANLAWVEINRGQFEDARSLAQEALRINPDSSFAHWFAAEASVGLNQSSDARNLVARAQARNIDNVFAHTLLYWVGTIENDLASLQTQLDWADSHPEGQWILLWDARRAAFSGRLAEARRVYQRAIDMAALHHDEEGQAVIMADEAATEAELGDPLQARNLAQNALKIARQPDALGLSAFALERSGTDSAGIVAEMKNRFPFDTRVQTRWIPIAQAAADIGRKNFTKAIDDLKIAAPIESGGTVPIAADFRPGFLRGEAYLRSGAAKEAAGEFRKILEHRGSSPLGITYPLAYLGLARALVMLGDRTEAQQNYQQFLDLWNNGDPGSRQLHQARSEFAKLNVIAHNP